MKYTVNERKFRTKKAVQDHVKRILHGGSVGELLSGDDLYFMLDFFKRFHRDWGRKKGCGIRHISKVIEPKWRRRAFLLTRIDGSTTFISSRLSNIQKQNARQDFMQALRAIIEPQIMQFKREAFSGAVELECPITGDAVHWNNCHVDHFEPTFAELASEFIASNNISDFSKLISKPKDMQTHYTLTNNTLVGKFYDFHAEKAKLRITSIEGNLTTANNIRI